MLFGGQGTGGYISLAAATLDSEQEIVTTTSPPNKFITEAADGTPVPMIIGAFNGDIYGTSLGTAPAGFPFSRRRHSLSSQPRWIQF